MSPKTVSIAIVIILVVAVGGGRLFARDTHPSLRHLPSAGTSSIKATATLNPAQPRAGEPTTIAFAFAHPDGSAVSDLMPHHARRVHVLIVSQDLRSFGHIHPQDFGEVTHEVVRSGRYAVKYTFPRAGRYMVGVDVMTADEAFSKQFLVDVEGAPKMADVAQKDRRREKCFRGYPQDGTDRYVKPVFVADAEIPCPKGYKVTMTPSVPTIAAGKEVRLRYRLEKDGEAVTDLAPYLGAGIHLAIVPASFDALLHRHGDPAHTGGHDSGMHAKHDMRGTKGSTGGHKYMAHAEHAMHRASDTMAETGHAHHSPAMAPRHHGSVPQSFGPELVSESFSFPRSGPYEVFAQVKHDGKIIFANFMVEVR